MKTKKTKEAVSLIVLVLTIVIMIILAGVIIINLNNSGIIDRAKTAVSETNLKNMQELANVAWGEAYLEIQGEKTKEAIETLMLAKLKGKGVSDEELDKYTFTVTTGGVEVAVKTGDEEDAPEPEVTGNPIPDGGVYITGRVPVEGLELEGEGTELDYFPETPSVGDTYEYGDYIYSYGFTYKDETGELSLFNGWNCQAKEAKATYDEILTNINGINVTGMVSAFRDNSELTTVPTIPSTISNMEATFYMCYNLTEVTINATPDFYSSCFYQSGITDVSQILGGCQNKESLVETNE